MKATKRPRQDDGGHASSFDDVFGFLLGMSESEFFDHFFEKKMKVFSRKSSPDFFYKRPLPRVQGLLDWSSAKMIALCDEKELHYGTDLNVVRYDLKDKQRVPFRTSGVVSSQELKKCFEEGWSVRFLRPQEHSETASAFIGVLEDAFQCSCGVNSYWTPKNSQGFAPHYDDVDVFLMQLEGSKQWRVYDPLEPVDHLTRHSSEDYKPEQLTKPPIFSGTLRAGDVLYMPRGFIHQGDTMHGEGSLHITFSAMQMHTYADLMIKLATYQIETLAANSVEWRRGIPRSWSRALGCCASRAMRDEMDLPPLSGEESKQRTVLLATVRKLIGELTESLQKADAIDHATDRYAVDVVSRCQPPHPTPDSEAGRSFTTSSLIKLVNPSSLRLVLSVPGEAQIFHSGNNSTICLANPVGQLRFEEDFAPAIGFLLENRERSIRIEEIPFSAFDDVEDQQENRQLLVQSLLDANLVVIVE